MVNKQFYDHAKQENIGFNQGINEDIEFYRNCRENQILPKPIFTAIKDNEFVMTG